MVRCRTGAPLGQRLPEKTSGPGGRGTARPPCLGGPSWKGSRPATRDFVGAKPAQHAYAKTASGDLGQPFWLCRAARVGAVSRPVLGAGPPGVFDSLRSPWGAGYCRGGACAGGGWRAFWRCFAGAIFRSECWSGSHSACAVAGAGARARPGGGLPTLSEPVAEPCGRGRRHSAPIEIGRLQRSHRVSWPTRWRGAPRTRAPVPLASTGCARGPTGGLPALSEPVAEPSGPGAATVRSGAVWRCFCWQHFFGWNAAATLRAPVPWRVQERVRGPAGGLPTLSEPVAEPSGRGRRHSASSLRGALNRLVELRARELGILRL